MAQYFDFGDQVGPLLNEALSRVERKREFDAQQASDYMRLQQSIEQFKSTMVENQRQFDVSRGDKVTSDIAQALNQIGRDYVDKNALIALGLDPRKYEGQTAEQIGEPYQKLYGDKMPRLPQGTYYKSNIVLAAKAALEQQRATEKLLAQMPVSLTGADRLPVPKTITKNVVEQSVELPFEPSIRNQYFRNLRSRVDPSRSSEGQDLLLTTEGMSKGERSMFLAGVAQQLPNIDISSVKKASYNPKTKSIKLDMLYGNTDEQGNPIPVEQYETYDKAEVESFFKNVYPELLKSYGNMKSIDKGREERVLTELGGRLQGMVSQYPQYAPLIAPFAGWAKRYQDDQAEFLMKLQQQRDIAAERQAGMILRSAAAKDPDVQEQLANQAKMILQQQLMQ